MNKTILVVDDDPINRKLIVKILEKKAFNTIEANNGLEALNEVNNNKNIDLILLDILMPVMNGIEFLKQIKANPSLINIPIIVLTTDDTKKTEVLSLGADDIIIKPLSPIALLEKISNYI